MSETSSPQSLIRRIARKESDKAAIARQVARNPGQLAVVIEGLAAKPAAEKYGCAKVLRIISEEHPEALYPHLDYFAGLLDAENNIFQWEGIHVIGNLAAVDRKKKIDRILGRYLSPIPGPVLVTAANVIGGAAKIAAAKPYLADKIAAALLKVGRARYKTPECRNIAKGKAVEAFNHFFDHIDDQAPVIRFVKRQLKNTRPGTRKKAEKFLKKRS